MPNTAWGRGLALGCLGLTSLGCTRSGGEVFVDIVRGVFEGDSVNVPKGDVTPPTAFLVLLGPGAIRRVDLVSGNVTVTVSPPTSQITVLAVAEDAEGVKEVHLRRDGGRYCSNGEVRVGPDIGLLAPQSIVRDQRPGERTTSRLSLTYAGALTTACPSGYILADSWIMMHVEAVNFAGTAAESPSATFGLPKCPSGEPLRPPATSHEHALDTAAPGEPLS